jgi:hypothetical protein
MAAAPSALNANDVVDWDYLCRIARPHDLAYSTDPRRALEIFAYLPRNEPRCNG